MRHYTINIRHCTIYTRHCTVYMRHFTINIRHCTINTRHCTTYTRHCTVYTRHYTIHTRLHNIHKTSHSIHEKLYNTHETLQGHLISKLQRDCGESVLVLGINPGPYSTNTELPKKLVFLSMLCTICIYFSVWVLSFEILVFFFSVSREFFILLENWLFVCSELQKISPGE